MKTKPTKHKETNTFKFKPFLERVNEIDIDVFHKVAHFNEIVHNETETYFYQCVQKWNFLNLSENYCNFRKEVVDIITLPQLLNKKQHVIDTLLKYLKLKDPLCLYSIFELTIAVVKDLQLDFYPYFPEFLASITSLLYTKDAEQLEHTFTTLAYLFKFQWRYIIKNVDKVFDILVPLLADTYPPYVNNFAAESFAFVVRKVKEKEAFLKLVLQTLEVRRDGVAGCGKLLFHVLSGIAGQFHSCTETILTLYINALLNPLINQQLLIEVLSTVFSCIAHEINPNKCDIFWTVIFKEIDAFSDNSLVSLLQLIQIVINYKGGQMLKDSLIWSKKLCEMIDKYQNSRGVLQEIINAVTVTLLASNITLLQETSSFLIIKLLSINDQDLLIQITEKLITYSAFESLVLPQILKKSIFSTMDEKMLQLLAKIIEAKSPPILCGINFDKWIKFNLDIRCMDSTIFLTKILDSLKERDITEDALKVLIILPHLTHLQEQLRLKLIEIFVFLFKRVLQEKHHRQRVNFSFILTMESVIHIMKPDDFHCLISEHVSWNNDLLSALNLHQNDISVLNALDLGLTYLKNSNHSEEYFNKINFDKLHQTLASKLGSMNPIIRLTTSHIYSLFSNMPGLNHFTNSMDRSANNADFKNAFELPYLVESEPITLHKYRERLQGLRALDFRGAAISRLDANYKDAPLHYLFGNLYINFSLLWDPVCEVLISYATDECSQFWPLFLSKLKNENKLEVTPEVPFFECDILSNMISRLFSSSDKVDHDNYTFLLWKCMHQIVNYCEVKNRDFVGVFIDFVDCHFFKSDSEDAKSCNILKREQEINSNDEQEKVKEEDNDDDETKEEVKGEDNDDDETKEEDQINNEKECASEQKEFHSKLTRTKSVKLLLAMLQTFGKFTNTRSLYREPEIQKIYLDLLSSKNSEIQKASLACLYTYKHKYLMPYKDHLDNIVDEKNLKNELIRFQISVDEANQIVLRDEHREDLMPIIMRILHAKMMQKVGMRTGGKSGGLVKRKTILRFLAGVKEEEMMIFVRMAFRPFQNYLPILTANKENQSKTDLRQMVHDIINNINLEAVIPPKRLQSIVNLLSVIIEQFGGKMMEKLLPHLFALLICVLAHISAILSKTNKVHSNYLMPIRNARNNSINILARFFIHFEDYDWSSSEIDALFDVAVFPWIQKLPIEGIHTPTPLLKMMAAWSKNPRYYSLFVKLNEDKETPLIFLVKLLLFERTHRCVLQTLLDMFEKMLTFQDFEREDPDRIDVDEFKPKSMLPIVCNKLDIVKDESINYGSAILLPHITDILKFFERNLKKHSRHITNRTELIILSRISEFVLDPKTCNTLLILILPILQKKCRDSEETVVQLLTTIINLIKYVEKPELHLRSIQHFLFQIKSASSRKILMEILNIVVKNNETMKKNQAVLMNLNAYDQRWIDQPDYEKRLNAFEEIDRLIKANEITLEFGVGVILNCFFFLKTDNDLAIRDRSGQCLKVIGVYLAKKFKDSAIDRKYLLEETILTIVRYGIRSKVENIKFQSIAFIGHMAMECPDVHPVLKDLHTLTNKQDPEVDFFENMQHLQLYRRSRAFLKFCKIARSMTKAPNSRTLTQFILPLCSSYLCNEKYIHKNSLIDTAIETIGVVCQLLPWNQYEIVLRFYLVKLRMCTEFQRQIIRIVVAILDSFHFNLSKYKEVEELSKEHSSLNLTVPIANTTANVLPKPSEELPSDKSLKPNEVDINETQNTEEIMIEHLDEALNSNSIIDNIDNIVEQVEEDATKDVPAVEKQTMLTQHMAKRLVYSISKDLLPQLHKAIASRTRYEGSHKVNKKRVSNELEEEELMRVPIALAMVKLLQKLPHGILEANLRGIFMKICTFLKSRLESVRRTTREILQSIMITLGPDYLHYLLKEMNTLLTRGFQVHVLAFTIHAVLITLKPFFKPKHISLNLASILSVCKIDLFGPSSEEKEVAGIVRNVSEAKCTKSFEIFHVLGEFVDEAAIIDVVVPLKDVLIRTRSHKSIRKIVESLRRLSLGLADNKYIEINELLNFLHGVSSESIPQLMPENLKEKETVQEKTLKNVIKKPDCFLIPPAPKTKMGIKISAKTSKNTNAHIMIEFSLRLFHILLKRDKVAKPELKPLLDRFVPVLSDCLNSQYVKLSALALQCLNWILKVDLPLVRTCTVQISTSIFNILHKYAVAGLSKGDNFDLVMAAFKCMSVLVRDVKHFVVKSDQLKVLLMYAEQDLYDSDKQATAFGLLKAIIHRKLFISEMHQVMENVATLSITSELDNVRKQARAVFYSYLMNYPLNKRLKRHISFYATQLGYELQPGRLSALEMIYAIVTSFPLEILIEYSGFLFLTVGARLINDDDPICKKVCATCINEIIDRIPHNPRNKLFNSIILWLKDKKIAHRQLAVQLCGIFVMVEKEGFEPRLKEILPLLTKQFYSDENFDDNDQCGRFVKVHKEKNHDIQSKNIKDPTKLKDHLFYQVLQLLLKICTNCHTFLKNEQYTEYVNTFAEYSQSLLAHPHLWVRLAASQMLGFVLAALNVEKVIHLINNPADCNFDDGYIYSNPIEQLRSLILDSIAQLQPDTDFEELYDQIIKNLIFISKLLTITKTDQDDSSEQDENNKNSISLLWLLKRLRKCINYEISQAPKSTIIRSSVFKWMAGVIVMMEIDSLKPILFQFMSPLVREMATIEESNAPLRQLAKQVATMIKKNMNIEDYTRLLSQSQQRIDMKKAERKKTRLQQVVIDPEIAAKRKISKQLKKKVARKRKIETLAGKRGTRKKVKKEVDFDLEEM
ncbi:PREDICTED: small subunit processome component 20 homolog [Ceratosolen solmsi marchali]|uniref:Small subunit processome component 20 homolog n=1 Tax=Ceratosolen solmsi marchali TaxID=326594 RepID=A0AAJ6YCP0_9HYME|nr:PREDICTED: small subunit processome component 20 homolog [Ceratosolen solmsi marchali]